MWWFIGIAAVGLCMVGTACALALVSSHPDEPDWTED